MKTSWRSELYSNLVSKKTVVLLGILFIVVYIPIFMHPNQPDEWWRNGGEEGVNVITELSIELSKMNPNDPQFIEKKRILMLKEYEWNHIDDFKRYEDNKILIMSYELFISLLCFYFAFLMKRRSVIMKTKWDALIWVWQSFIISMVFALFLILMQVLFSLWLGKVLLNFEGFFRSIFFLNGDKIIEVPGWMFLLVTRGLSLIQIAVFCVLGIFMRRICDKKGFRVVLMIVFTPIYFYFVFGSFGKLDYFIFCKYILYEYLWGGDSLLVGGSIWWGLIVHIAWLLIFFIGAVWLTYRNGEKTRIG